MTKIKMVVLFSLFTLLIGCSGELPGNEAPMPLVTTFNVDQQKDVEIPHVFETICWNDCGISNMDPYTIKVEKTIEVDDQPIRISFENMDHMPATINLINETTDERLQFDSEWVNLIPSAEGETTYRLHLFWRNGKDTEGEAMYVFSVKK